MTVEIEQVSDVTEEISAAFARLIPNCRAPPHR